MNSYPKITLITRYSFQNLSQIRSGSLIHYIINHHWYNFWSAIIKSQWFATKKNLQCLHKNNMNSYPKITLITRYSKIPKSRSSKEKTDKYIWRAKVHTGTLLLLLLCRNKLRTNGPAPIPYYRMASDPFVLSLFVLC
jgi:hypothetical protein